MSEMTAARYETDDRATVKERPIGAVTEGMSRLQHQIEQLAIHVDELRGRLGLALSPEEPGEVLDAEGKAVPRRQPSELAGIIEECVARIQRLRCAVSEMHDRVDL